MAELARYRTFISDNARWDGFAFRDDDIVICTPPKAGTTWTQQLCALLLFDGEPLDQPLSDVSPWLDMLTVPLDDVLARLEAQEHRRFVKTHTPLDGVPWDDRVTYVGVGRDPRDIGFSWDNHASNLDLANLLEARERAVGLDDLTGLEPPPAPAEDPLGRFWQWCADPPPGTGAPSGLGRTITTLRSLWERRDRPNVTLLHYTDLVADLPGELDRLARALGIDLDEQRRAELAEAATFDAMRQRADELVPGRSESIWQSNRQFFEQGPGRRWQDVLGDEDVARYEERIAELSGDDEFLAWVHGGRRAAPDLVR